MSSRRRQALSLLGWAAAATAAIGVLHAAGEGVLAAPRLTSPSTWDEWLAGRDPVVAAFALGRLGALGAAGYVAAVTAAGAAARMLSGGRASTAVDRLTVPVLRRLMAATMSVSLGTGGLAPALAADSPPAATATTTTVAVAVGDNGPPPTITMRRLPPPDGGGAADPAVDPPPPAGGGPSAAGRTWTVIPGQCFWSIAEAVLAESLGREPTADEVVPYWQRLIDANRSALGDPANPDLVFPGQVFGVPAP